MSADDLKTTINDAVDLAYQRWNDQRALDLDTARATWEQEKAALTAEIARIKNSRTVRTVLLGASMNGDTDGIEKAAGLSYDVWRIFLDQPNDKQKASLLSKIRLAGKLGRKYVMVSFKVPDWSKASVHDSAFKTIAQEASALLVSLGMTGYFTVNHEPENDTGTNKGNTAAGQAAWTAMQARYAPIFKSFPNIRYGVILMGWYSFPESPKETYALWKLENAVPPVVDFVAFDLYQWWGLDTKWKWTDMTPGPRLLAAYCNPRGIEWGLAEFGITGRAFADARGERFYDDLIEQVRALGGSFALVFNNSTYLNVTPAPAATQDTLLMETDGARFREWTSALTYEGSLRTTG
jgi:hypothetical protein